MSDRAEETERSVFVGNLPWGATEAQLRDLFAVVDLAVEEVRIPTDDEGRGKGFAFLRMGSPEAAGAAVEMSGQLELGGRRLRMDLARPRRDRGRNGDRRERRG